MSDDDEYVEGDSNSAPADAPGAVPADDAPRERADVGDTIDSVATHDAPVLSTKRNTARTVASRKAFAEAILANKKATPAPAPEDIADPDDPPAAAAPVPEPVAAAAPAPAPAPAPVPAAAPPAPSLDPEVRKLKEQLAAERKALEAERAEIEKRKAEPVAAPTDALSLEDYIDSPPKAYRTWLETMRGEKFASDDEYKAEVKDFVTAMSTEVLGVALPENIRAQFDAAQAKKIVRTHKTIQSRREAAAAAKAEKERAEAAERAEAERVEQEWGKAATVLSQQFAAQPDATGTPQPSVAAKTYPWLAAEDEPGRIVVDVIRAAMTKDGTQLSWQEASKRANEYLEEQAKRYYDKRKPLLGAVAPAATPAAKPAAPVVPVPLPEARVVSAPKKWSRDQNLENSKAAFRRMLAQAEKTE